MIIRRVEVRNFRKLVEPVAIENLSDGLTIVVGDNEEGKSTMLQAIRSCFFDKHNMTGERAQSFQPYNSSVQPEVRIDFERNGKRYKLFKAFCHKPQAELITPAGRLADAAAEEELGKLLRFTPPQRAPRTTSGHEHEGIFGMFWVEQGKSFDGVNATVDGRSSIHQALQHEVGDVLGGKRGQKLLAEVSKRRNEVLTATGRPKGEYANALEAQLRIQGELTTLLGALTAYERDLEDLERCRARQKRYEADRAVERAEERLRSARDAAESVGALRHTLEQSEATLATSRAEHDLAANRAEQRTRLIDDVEKRKFKLSDLKASWEAKQRLLDEARGHMTRDERDLARAVQTLERAEAALVVATAAEQLARVQSDLNKLLRQENSALEAKSKAENAVKSAGAIGIEKKDITRLKHLQEAVTKAQAELNALATNVRVDLEPGVKARIGRATVVSGTEHRITETAVIDIAECAKVTVVPGGEIGNPRAELVKAQEKLKNDLIQLGVTSSTEADSRWEERQTLLNQAQKYQDIVQAHAPDGLDVLQTAIAELRGEVQRLTEQAGREPRLQKDASATLREAQRARDNSEQERKAAEKRATTSRDKSGTTQSEEASAKASHDSEAQHMRELEQRLTNERKNIADGDLQKAVLAAAQRVTVAEQTTSAAKRALEEANPDSVDLELSAAEDALKVLHKEIRNLSDRSIALESELRAIGAQGLGERKQQLEGELEAATALAASLERQVKTVDLLHRMLVQAERAAKDTFLRPVTHRIQPYLKLLLPGSELRMSDELDIVGLRRGNVEEEFTALSLGTREQVAVLARLAFADLLRENGQPATVLLDDAIVYADDDRFRRMLHILRKASEKTQIIVFTCREREYENAGAPIIRLAECRIGAASPRS
jgi:uncharacterized protein YhaN